MPLRVSAVSTQVPCPLSRCVSVLLQAEMGDTDGLPGGSLRAPESSQPRALSRREGGSGGPSLDCLFGPYALALAGCQALTLGGGLALTLASTSDTAPPSPIPAQLVPKLSRRGQHEGRGPPVPGGRPSVLRSWGWNQLLPCSCAGWWELSVTAVWVDESSACKRV